MTSEVLIMNRLAVALAADSTATISTGAATEKKYVRGVNKLFELSDHEPVGVMVFGGAELLEVPWELIVKDFRSVLGQTYYKDIQGYAQAFIAYLEGNDALFPRVSMDEQFTKKCIANAVWLIEALEQSATVKAAPDASQKDAARLAEFAAFELQLKNLSFPPTVSDQDFLSYTVTFLSAVVGAIVQANQVLMYPIPAEAIALAAMEFYVKSMADERNGYTGVVFAGYGRDDYYPAYRECKVHGFVPGKLVYSENAVQAISDKSHSAIAAFAMQDMVNTFIYGISPQLFGTLWGSCQKHLAQLEQTLLATHNSLDVTAVQQAFQVASQQILEQLQDGVVQEHRLPLQSAVSSLPVDEMARLAETLVGLESLKERVTSPSESVGGPVDVVVITRSEGLVWVKRKHYFGADLNSKYFERQRRRISC